MRNGKISTAPAQRNYLSCSMEGLQPGKNDNPQPQTPAQKAKSSFKCLLFLPSRYFGNGSGYLPLLEKLESNWEERMRQSVPFRGTCWGSAGKFSLHGVFLGTSCSSSQHFFLASFSGCSNTNLHRINPIL